MLHTVARLSVRACNGSRVCAGRHGPSERRTPCPPEPGPANVLRRPAEGANTPTRQARDRTSLAFDALGLRDMARADFRLDPEGALHLLEVNGLPGPPRDGATRQATVLRTSTRRTAWPPPSSPLPQTLHTARLTACCRVRRRRPRSDRRMPEGGERVALPCRRS
ncbi:hypothetical protein ACIQNK_06855 [Streptomyces sp. NPDC091273]|uniref:hypothetical protein n=1 Tax=Streptomyces sp. NPDC091273 TaxID=3365982 RepID=UPI0037FBC212